MLQCHHDTTYHSTPCPDDSARGTVCLCGRDISHGCAMLPQWRSLLRAIGVAYEGSRGMGISYSYLAVWLKLVDYIYNRARQLPSALHTV